MAATALTRTTGQAIAVNVEADSHTVSGTPSECCFTSPRRANVSVARWHILLAASLAARPMEKTAAVSTNANVISGARANCPFACASARRLAEGASVFESLSSPITRFLSSS
jgi:hypothetical protein